MQFKKIFLSAALISMAGFVACGDDSSSNSNSKELPPSVPTFFDLADVECNADRKCETIIVEEGPDTYECDGKQWNMLINSMPSKVCPAEEEKKTEGDDEGKTEGDDNKAPESSASETTSTDSGATSTDSGAASTDSNTESANSGEGSEGGDKGGEGSEGGEELTGPTGDLYSCLQDSDIMGMKTKICTETTANSATATELKATCTSFDYEGMKMTSTEGTGCSAETGYVKKCVVSNDAAVYFFDADAADKSCEDLLKDKN